MTHTPTNSIDDRWAVTSHLEDTDRRFEHFSREEQIVIARGLVRSEGLYTLERDPVINFLLSNIHWFGWAWMDRDEWEASLLSDELDTASFLEVADREWREAEDV